MRKYEGNKSFTNLEKRVATWIAGTVILFTGIFCIILYISFSRIVYDDLVEKMKKFSDQTVCNVEQKLSRMESIVDESVSKYSLLKSNPDEADYYRIDAVLSDITKSYYELKTFIFRNGKTEQLSAGFNAAEIQNYMVENYDSILDSISENQEYYGCISDKILYIRQAPGEEQGCLMGVAVPAQLFTEYVKNTENIFYNSLNIFIHFENGSNLQINTGNDTFSDIKSYVNKDSGVYIKGNRIITKGEINDGAYSVIIVQKTDFANKSNLMTAIILLVVFLLISALCIFVFRRMIFNIINPMEDLREQMNNYTSLGSDKDV